MCIYPYIIHIEFLEQADMRTNIVIDDTLIAEAMRLT